MSHDHDHSHSHHHHASSGKKGWKLAAVILFNIAITVAEYIGGIISGSLALISDAGHNFSDVLSLMLGYAGEKVSGKSPTSSYSFGLKRFEVLIALVNSTSLIGIGAYILYESVVRFLHPAEINIGIMLPVACVGLAGNVLSILLLFGERKGSLNMKAAFLHLLFDAISSIAVVAAALIMEFTGIYWIDLAISVIIVFMIFWGSADILKESLRIFLQGTPHSIDADDVYGAIRSVEGVGSVHGLHIWSISSQEVFLSAHICIGKDGNDDGTDAIIRKINSVLEEKYGIRHTTLQIEQTLLCSLDGGDCCR